MVNRFVCPSGSTQSIAGPSKPSKRTKAAQVDSDIPHKRGRTYLQRAAKVKDAGEAKKKLEKRLKVKTQKPRVFAHVYIGNLESTVTEKTLEQHFSGCGRIRKTTLRVSRGQAITVGIAIPATTRCARDRKYATMEFHDPKSVAKALRMNNTMLDGSKLLVSAAAGDLPEVADIARPHLQSINARNHQHQQARNSNRAPRDRASNTPKPLTRTDTVRDFTDPNNNNKVRIMGWSFDKCIM